MTDLEEMLLTAGVDDHEHQPHQTDPSCIECVRRVGIMAEWVLSKGGVRWFARMAELMPAWRANPRLVALVGFEAGRRARHSSAAGTPPAYVCPTCGRASWHPEDGRNKFCGVCGFEADRRPR